MHHALKDMAAWGKPRKRDSYSHLQMNYFTVIRKLIYACPDTNDFIIIGRFFSSQAWDLSHVHNERNPDNSPTSIMVITKIMKITVQTLYATPKGVQGIGGKNSFYKYFIPHGI